MALVVGSVVVSMLPVFLSVLVATPVPQQWAEWPEVDPVSVRAAQLRSELGSEFTVIVERPFVVVGDESPKVVKHRARSTVRWAVQHLKRDFFPKDPDRVIDIWLFRNRASYERNALRRFGHKPDTPFGYYSPQHRALVMNIFTGGGTLVHELVHPFMEANFENCPAWFNEGLGSLYEQSGERGGQIVGFTNWRLDGLQEAIRDRSLPSSSVLLRTSDLDFYERDPGTNYAQARYLLMYLQEKSLLREFYRRFRATAHKDGSGETALKQVLGVSDLRRFDPHWRAWVSKLRFM